MSNYTNDQMERAYPPAVWDRIVALHEKGTGSASDISVALLNGRDGEPVRVPTEHIRAILKMRGFSLKAGANSGISHFAPQIKEMLAKGYSRRRVAMEIGVPYATVYRWADQLGVTESTIERRLVLAHDRIVALRQGGASVNEISEEVEISVDIISKYLRDHGFEVAVPGRKVGYAPKKSKYLSEVLRLHAEGKTIYEIADSIRDVHYSTVALWLREEGLDPRYGKVVAAEKKVDGRSLRYINDAEVQRRRKEVIDLLRQGKPNAEVSALTGVPESTVATWKSRYAPETVTHGRSFNRSDPVHLQRIVDAWDEGKPITEIMATVLYDFYFVKKVLIDAGRIENDGSVKMCALSGCTTTVVERGKFCSREHAQTGGGHRQADPENWEDILCPNYQDPRCQCHGGTTVSVRKRRHQLYCSAYCAKRFTKKTQHYVIRDEDVVLDSSWETVFWGLAKYLKIRIERFDRSECVEFDGSIYGPDFRVFLGSGSFVVEIKGQVDPTQVRKWDAWVTNKDERLMVVDKEGLDRLRKVDSIPEFARVLWTLEHKAPQ